MKFEVNEVRIIEQEDGFKYYGIFDKEDKNWYEEQKKFKNDTLKIMYNKDSLSILAVNTDVSMLAPTVIGDVVEETEYKETEIDTSMSHSLYFINGKITKLKEWEIIKDGKVTFDKEFKKTTILKELTNLKIEYSEKEFIFKEKYLQKNRELDKNNLGNIVTMLLVSKQQHFKDWKFKDKDGNDVYVDLAIQEMLQMADIMQKQTTKAMKIESSLIKKIETLSDEELKIFNSRKEYEDLWNRS